MFTVGCLTLPHPAVFKETGDFYDICMDVHTLKSLLFPVPLAEGSSPFTYKEADLGGHGLRKPEQ